MIFILSYLLWVYTDGYLGYECIREVFATEEDSRASDRVIFSEGVKTMKTFCMHE